MPTSFEGRRVVIPVRVTWPELQLTKDQHLQNVIADMNGEDRPWLDHSVFEIVIYL